MRGKKSRKKIAADAFYINPPYSSKTLAKAVKLWLNRASQTVGAGSACVLVYPIDFGLPWTLSGLAEVQSYASLCGLVVTGVQRNIHTYEYLPNDPGLLSSNIYLYKFKKASPPKLEEIESEQLYR
jgi:hypothetical protein